MFQAYRVYMDEGQAVSRVESVDESVLPSDGVVVDVSCSCINYKDALSARGYPGVTKHYPHIPGIDAAGIAKSGAYGGTSVLVTGFELGVGIPGGFGAKVRVPEEWIIPLPENLSQCDAMRYGTAGLTAGLSLLELIRSGLRPDDGAVAVSGASGGVGSLAVGMLARLGYTVTAITRSPQATETRLRAMGASNVVSTEEVSELAQRPIARAQWVGAIDAAGGEVLAGLLAATERRGTVTACGLVSGSRFDASVLPFILRGVRLIGIDSVYAPYEDRCTVWESLAGRWRPENLESGTYVIGLEAVDTVVDSLLAGTHQGRAVIQHGSQTQ